MERRVLLAIFLSFLVLYTYQALFVPASKPAPSAAPSPDATDASAAAQTPAPAAAESAATQPATPTAPPWSEPRRSATIRLETDEVIAVFTNRGARLKSWRLKHYRDEKGEPLELVAGDLGSAQPLPFSLRVPDEAATRTLNSALYEVKSAPAEPTAARSAPLIFEYRDSAGLQAIKEFRFDPAPYAFTFHASVKIGDRPVVPVIEWGPAVSSGSREEGTSARQAGGRHLSEREVAAHPARRPRQAIGIRGQRRVTPASTITTSSRWRFRQARRRSASVPSRFRALPPDRRARSLRPS